MNERRTRDGFGEVMEAQRQAISRANALRLSAGEYRVLLAVLSLVASYSRLRDRVYVAQVVTRTEGLSERYVRDCLAKLARLGIIYWEPHRGHGAASVLGLPRAGETGRHAVPVSHSRHESVATLAGGESA